MVAGSPSPGVSVEKVPEDAVELGTVLVGKLIADDAFDVAGVGDRHPAPMSLPGRRESDADLAPIGGAVEPFQ